MTFVVAGIAVTMIVYMIKTAIEQLLRIVPTISTDVGAGFTPARGRPLVLRSEGYFAE